MSTVQTNPQSPTSLTEHPILGFPVHLHNDYLQWLIHRLEQRLGAHVVTLNAEMVMQAQTEPALAAVIQQADLVIPDGAGIVLSLKFRGQSVSRCPGIELAKSLLEQSAQLSPAPSVFFLGGSPGVAAEAAQKLKEQFPNLNMVGTEHGYLDPAEMVNMIKQLQTKQPQIIFVGLGVPRQEYWIADHRDLVPNALWIGVGGSFDIWADRKKRAPEWLRNNHLEWTYRLYQEPWRWRRMMALPKFAWRSFVDAVR